MRERDADTEEYIGDGSGVSRTEGERGIFQSRKRRLPKFPPVARIVSDFFTSIVDSKVRLSICAGLCAGFLVALAFISFEMGKEQWMLKQRYPYAVNAAERRLLYSQDLVQQGEYGKAETVLRELLDKGAQDATHADALLLLPQTIEMSRDDDQAAEEVQKIYREFISTYPADQRAPAVRIRLAEYLAGREFYYDSNTELEKALRAQGKTDQAPEIRLLIARNYYQVGNCEKATEILEQLLLASLQSPDSLIVKDATLLLAQAYLGLGERGEAESLLTGLIRNTPGTPHAASALRLLAHSSFDQGDFQKAGEYCTRWLAESPVARDRVDMMLLYGKTRLALKKPEEAAEAASDVITFYSGSPALVDAFILRSQAMEAMNRMEDAEEACREAMGFFPKNPLPVKHLAHLCASQGNAKEAIRLMEHVCQLDSQDDAAVMELAKLYRNNGENVKAESLLEGFTHTHQLSPLIGDAFLLLADIQTDLKKREAAFDTLDLGLAIRTTTLKDNVAFKRQGDLLFDAGLYDDALKAYASAREIGGNSTVLRAKTAETLFALGRKDEALKEMSAIPAHTLSPADRFDLLRAEAQAMLDSGDFQSANRLIHEALALKSGKENFSILALLMHLNLKLGDDREAKKVFQVTMKLIGMEDAEAPFEARRIVVEWTDHLYEKRKYAEAAEAYAKILQPRFSGKEAAWAAYQEGNCYYNLNEFTRANLAYAKMEDQFPDSEWLSFARQRKNMVDLLVKNSGSANR